MGKTKEKDLPKFTEFLKHSDDKASVWYYFLREETGQSAKCKEKKCDKIIKTSGGSTSGLHCHHKSVHSINLLKRETNLETQDTGERKTKPRTISSFFLQKKRTLDEILARMASKDGIPFAVFATSVDMREALKENGFENLPKLATAIRNSVVNYSKNIREEQRIEVGESKKRGKKFYVIFDEWTSSRNRRYMNIILQENNSRFWNLGLIRMKGFMPAEKCLGLVEAKLLQYDLTLKKDIVCIITDGSSVMTKIGRLAPIFQQLCFAHGVQLAVMDILYNKKKPMSTNIEMQPPEVAFSDHLDMPDVEFSEESNSDSDMEDNGRQDFTVLHDNGKQDVTHVHLRPVIDKVRRIVRQFRRSPTKNEVLQDYVKQEFGKEMQILLETKTRWNSLLIMLERFLKLKTCIKKALVDVDPDLIVKEWEFDRISDVIEALQPFKAAVEALCRRDANLITSDVALKFTRDKLAEQNTAISLELLETLQRRIDKRRTDCSGVLSYLHNGKFISEDDDEVFYTPNRNRICNVIKDMIERLCPPDQSEFVNEESLELEELQSHPHSHKKKHLKSDFEEELDKAINAALVSTHVEKPTTAKTLAAAIKKEMRLFEDGGRRGFYLEKPYDFLLGVLPTSVESERAFSSSGYLCNKVRCRLDDQTLDELCFLRSHFRNVTENI